MKRLKKDIGRVETKALGISLNPNSTQAQIESAIKHNPSLAQYFEEVKEKAVKAA